MKRRNFLRTVLPIGLFAGGIINLNALQAFPENIIIRSGLPQNRFQEGIKELGGIKRFVSKGDRVVIKPTMAFDKAPKTGFNSNPDLIKEIINQCVDAKVKVVSVFDQAIDPWTKCYKNSGIERIAKDAFARVLPANDERFYTEVKFEAEKSEVVKIHQAVLEADVVINVAAARVGDGNQNWGAVKNLAGCAWPRKQFENAKNENRLVELAGLLKPALNVVDSVDFQVVSINCLLADFLTLENLNIDVKNISYLEKAYVEMESTLQGNMLSVKEIKL